jgi:1-phosphatidylinositol phosphodiesterase
MDKQTFIAAVLGLAAMLSQFGCTRELHTYEVNTAPFFRGASGPNATPPAGASVALSSWMATLPDQVSLSQLSLPGSHNAGARYEHIGGTARCQALTIGEQLQAGIRFLDIRCRHIGDSFMIYHGYVYQNITFDDVMNACTEFLDRNPSECVIVSIKEEYNPAHNTRSFEQTFDDYTQRYAGKWYLGAAVPNLRQARGKLVLLRRFEATHLPKGIDASGWAHNTTFTISNEAAHLRIQDQFLVPDSRAKWGCSTALLTEARERNTEALYINFASGYRPALFRIPNIRRVANTMSAYITQYFSSHPKGRYGIIAMDFADAAKSSLIITTNYSSAARAPLLTYALNKGK